MDDSDESTLPRRLNGTSMDAPSYQNLHRELLLSHKRYGTSNELTLGPDLRADRVCAWWMVQGPAAGGEAGTEESVGAAQAGAAQGGGDGTTAALGPWDRAPQEAAEAGGGQAGEGFV